MRPLPHLRTAALALGVMIAAAATFSAAPGIAAPTLSGDPPIVIAHRGASGYLPEHTLAAYELAVRMGAQYIEPDLQLTKDGHLVAMHDNTLTRTTDVTTVFPGRSSYAVSEFTLAEVKQLTVKPQGTAQNTYPGFAPSSGADALRVPTFQEVIDLAKTQGAALGKTIGLYPEAKQADPVMEDKILSTLKSSGYGASTDMVYIQSFASSTVKSLADKQVAEGMDLMLVQLGAAVTITNPDGSKTYLMGVTDSATPLTFEELALYADGIGIVIDVPIYPITEEFIAAAHAAGLEVHGWTFADPNAESAIANYLKYMAMGMDGFFSNYPNLAVAAVPAPGALGLLGLGLVGLVVAGRRKIA